MNTDIMDTLLFMTPSHTPPKKESSRDLIKKIIIIKNKYHIEMFEDGKGFYKMKHDELVDILNRVSLYQIEEEINILCDKRNTMIINGKINAIIKSINFLE